MSVTIDNFEDLTSNVVTQCTKYLTSAEAVDQEQTTSGQDEGLGDVGGSEYRSAQGFVLSNAAKNITALEFKTGSVKSGTPTGNWTLSVQTDNAGIPSGTLVDANATVTFASTLNLNTVVKQAFAIPFNIGDTNIRHFMLDCPNQSNTVYWSIRLKGVASSYAGGKWAESINGTWTSYTNIDCLFKIYVQDDTILQSYSEGTIKTTGTYALKGVAAQTTSLNKTLIKTFSAPIDLTGQSHWKFDYRSSRTGQNVKIGIKDSGGTITEYTPNVAEAGVFATYDVDISAVSDANKDAISQVIITITNADAANTFYLDNMYADTGSSSIIPIAMHHYKLLRG